jgi:hypothetical protein
MFLEKADKQKMMQRNVGKIQALLKEFMASDMDCAKVRIAENEYASATAAYSSIRNAIKRLRMENVRVFVNNKDVYIVKLDGSEEV